jgi:hypothetical protein
VHLNTRREETVCETKIASEFRKEGGDVYWIRMTREWIQLLAFCEHINEPPEYSYLIPTVRASQSFETPNTTQATKQRHVIEDLGNCAFKNLVVTTSGVNENWTLFGLVNYQQLLKTDCASWA